MLFVVCRYVCKRLILNVLQCNAQNRRSCKKKGERIKLFENEINVLKLKILVLIRKKPEA